MIGGCKLRAILAFALVALQAPAWGQSIAPAPGGSQQNPPPTGPSVQASAAAPDDPLSISAAQTRMAQKNFAEAVAILTTLADRGDQKAGAMLARILAFGPREVQDFKAAVKQAQSSADQGVADGQEVLGLLYLQGVGVVSNPAAAAKWLRLAANQDEVTAQFQMGVLYTSGHGVRKDPAEAMRWYVKAAEQGFSSAYLTIAAAFSEGAGLPKDPRQSFFWYSVALPRLSDNGIASAAARGRDKVATGLTYDETKPYQIVAATWVPTKGALDSVRAQIGKTTPEMITRDSGSGFSVAASGEILTARHVVKGCKRISVSLPSSGTTTAPFWPRTPTSIWRS